MPIVRSCQTTIVPTCLHWPKKMLSQVGPCDLTRFGCKYWVPHRGRRGMPPEILIPHICPALSSLVVGKNRPVIGKITINHCKLPYVVLAPTSTEPLLSVIAPTASPPIAMTRPLHAVRIDEMEKKTYIIHHPAPIAYTWFLGHSQSQRLKNVCSHR